MRRNRDVDDGVLFGAGDGTLYRAFCPRWYQLGRWIGFAIRRWRGEAVGVVVITRADREEFELRIERIGIQEQHVLLPSVPPPGIERRYG